MPDPLTLISMGIPLIQGIAGMFGKNKAKKEHQAAYDDLMNQNFGATPTAIKMFQEPVSRAAMDRQEQQIMRGMGTSANVLGKGDSRAMSQIGNVLQQGYDEGTKMLMIEDKARRQAGSQLAGQEMQGQMMKRNIEAQNVGGMAQREMQEQGNINSALTGATRNLMALGLGGYLGGNTTDAKTTGNVGDSELTNLANGGSQQNLWNPNPQDPYNRGLGGGFNYNLLGEDYQLPSIFNLPNLLYK